MTDTNTLRENAVSIDSYACTWNVGQYNEGRNPDHAGCVVTNYLMAEQFRAGDKAHAMTYSHHSGDDKTYRAASPYCGSKKRGYAYSGQFVEAITCGRCRR